MSGYETFMRFKRIEETANKMGFRVGHPKHGWSNDDTRDTVSLYPKDDALPVYNRDAEIFCGSFVQVQTFLTGWERAQAYDMMIRLSDDKKRKKSEDRERERQRLEAERLEKRKVFAALADRKEEDVDRLVK